MGEILEFEFPKNTEHRYLHEMTSAPYTVDNEFLNEASRVITPYDKVRFVEARPWLKDLMGLSKKQRLPSGATIHYEEALEGGRFRNSGWHTDGFSEDNMTIFATSTPSLVASCQINIKDEALVAKTLRTAEDDKEYSTGIFSTLTLIEREFGQDWVEIAGGLSDAEPEQREKITERVEVNDLAITQLMPCVAITAAKIKTLHKSAYRHPSQPAIRVFGRTFK